MTSSRIAGLPVLTIKDPDLVPGGVIRDPMGMLAIWRSGLGRTLVPHLASSVTRLHGIVAVILIQYVFEELRQDNSRISRTKCFRMLEGIVEYCLKAKSAAGPIYGGRPLAAEDFEASVDDRRTVANGLRQYYQGTCIRAGLIRRNSRTLSDEARSWCESPRGEIKPLVDTMCRLVKAGKFKTSRFEAEHPNFIGHLERFLSRTTWARDLRTPLLGANESLEFARLCSVYHLNSPNLKSSLSTLSSAPSKVDYRATITQTVAQIEWCEPFLCWCHGTLEWLRQNDRELLSDCVKNVSDFLPYIAAAADKFQQISDTHRTQRYRQILPVAQSASARDAEAFITALFRYHSRVMSERGADPLVGVEGDGTLSVTVRSTGDTSLNALHTRIKAGAWMNDYYLTAAGKIYLQTVVGATRG